MVRSPVIVSLRLRESVTARGYLFSRSLIENKYGRLRLPTVLLMRHSASRMPPSVPSSTPASLVRCFKSPHGSPVLSTAADKRLSSAALTLASSALAAPISPETSPWLPALRPSAAPWLRLGDGRKFLGLDFACEAHGV